VFSVAPLVTARHAAPGHLDDGFLDYRTFS
jgi:hypothetical protein